MKKEKNQDKVARITNNNDDDYSSLSVSMIQISINEITERRLSFHKLMIHVKMKNASDDDADVAVKDDPQLAFEL